MNRKTCKQYNAISTRDKVPGQSIICIAGSPRASTVDSIYKDCCQPQTSAGQGQAVVDLKGLTY